jgi:hypothetical protein
MLVICAKMNSIGPIKIICWWGIFGAKGMRDEVAI